jgi:mediator of RNA polymerase II transcription subunit 5
MIVDPILALFADTVLSLYRTYPGDSDLQSYLRLALRNGLISVPHYVATIVQATRSPELHTPAILNSLCQIILDEHVTRIHPNQSTFPFSESSGVVLDTVQDGLAILRTAHSLTLSPGHPLMVSASELLIFLLSRVSDISQGGLELNQYLPN